MRFDIGDLLFFLVIFAANIMQGITGFAGTILAMTPGAELVGFEVARPVLNILGILAGIYVLCTSFRYVNKKELYKILSIMTVGILAGILIGGFIAEGKLQNWIFGILIMVLSIHGLIVCFRRYQFDQRERKGAFLLLLLAGVIHGTFNCGGPFLINYLAKRIQDKQNFRATISTVWIVLNIIILVSDAWKGNITYLVLEPLIYSVPAMLLGMHVGSVLCKHLKQLQFKKITYCLLLISGILMLAR